MIKVISVVKIEHAELYDPDGYPIDGGLCDLRLGVVDPGLRCRTCGGTIGQCLGHFGHLELTKPVIHPLYSKKIFMILRSICQSCGKILATEAELKGMKNPLKGIYQKKIKTCPHCKEKQKTVEFQKPTTFREGNVEITPEDIRQRLEKVSDEDAKLLKIKGGRPEWFILTILPIPPVTVRPSITLETGERSEDDVTHKLVDVVRINERFRKNLELGAPDFIIADIWELLQYHISTLMDNEISMLPPARHRSGRALKTFVQRLSKKEGRFRGNLSGKRVNFSARTVISPDPMISLNEVGVTLEIAKELTVPVKVSEKSIDELKQYVMNGPNIHPGANYVCRADGIRKKITDENKKDIAAELDMGYIVERHIKDGDISVFNRQPSLHRMSMMSHRIRVMPFRTFRINLTVTVPYNADFDGDEMNLHIPQTVEAQAEAEMLMLAEKNIRSPRYGLPIITCKHDHITGCYMLTKYDSVMTRKDVAEILASVDMLDHMDAFGNKEKISGKDVFSLLLPNDLNIEFRSSVCNGCARCKKAQCENDAYVIIKNGKLQKGIIDDNALGEKKGKLLDRIERLYGHKKTREFLDAISRISLEVISRKGFSVSIGDTDIPSSAVRKIESVIEECEDKVKKIIKSGSSSDDMEMRIQQCGGEATNEASEIVRKNIPFNNAVIMATTGARGSFVNLAQMCAFVVCGRRRRHRPFKKRWRMHISGDLESVM
ncbi:MAG: DNA-directed RNA polymerase subunit A' [Candidatus Aenigmarchaeota archaeon]|nr:DNA-directed RNA polymerase subunit A' [Candidatus Aenigmarchaeota archaeon]